MSEDILEKRRQIYGQAGSARPERWSGEIRNWTLNDKVWLNPERSTTVALHGNMAAVLFLQPNAQFLQSIWQR